MKKNQYTPDLRCPALKIECEIKFIFRSSSNVTDNEIELNYYFGLLKLIENGEYF